MVFRKFRTPLVLTALAGAGCHGQPAPPAPSAKPTVAAPAKPAHLPIPVRTAATALGDGETFAYAGGVAKRASIDAATKEGLLDVDLGV